MSVDLEKRAAELEKFVKTYYNCFINSRKKNGIYSPISNNDQFFLYGMANRLLGEPNGKNLIELNSTTIQNLNY